MKRDFLLPQADIQHLDAAGFGWETIRDQGIQWLIVRGWPVPDGYNLEMVDMALMIPPTYPDADVDMVYFFPALNRLDGGVINALSTHQIEGKEWQRWSRHRTPENPWRPEVDDISAQFVLVKYWLTREFSKPKT